MITGFNTDVEFEGRVYHVQTEDKGLDNPIIETLVYTGGEIVCARKNSYRQMLVKGDCHESMIQQRMEAQHRELIRSPMTQNGSSNPMTTVFVFDSSTVRVIVVALAWRFLPRKWCGTGRDARRKTT